jgi:hypothetical protein
MFIGIHKTKEVVRLPPSSNRWHLISSIEPARRRCSSAGFEIAKAHPVKPERATWDGALLGLLLLLEDEGVSLVGVFG